MLDTGEHRMLYFWQQNLFSLLHAACIKTNLDWSHNMKPSYQLQMSYWTTYLFDLVWSYMCSFNYLRKAQSSKIYLLKLTSLFILFFKKPSSFCAIVCLLPSKWTGPFPPSPINRVLSQVYWKKWDDIQDSISMKDEFDSSLTSLTKKKTRGNRDNEVR